MPVKLLRSHSSRTGRRLLRRSHSGRIKMVEAGFLSSRAFKRALARRARAKARAETTAAIEAARRGEVRNLGNNLNSIMAALDAD